LGTCSWRKVTFKVQSASVDLVEGKGSVTFADETNGGWINVLGIKFEPNASLTRSEENAELVSAAKVVMQRALATI
jgi:hypothetical protein